MTKPLAIVVFENLLPGNQLVNRLEDTGYRVQTLGDSTRLVEHAKQEMPIIVIMDLELRLTDPCAAIIDLKKHPDTAHIPVLAFAGHKNTKLQTTARQAGATLVASDTVILRQLPELLEQTLCGD